MGEEWVPAKVSGEPGTGQLAIVQSIVTLQGCWGHQERVTGLLTQKRYQCSLHVPGEEGVGGKAGAGVKVLEWGSFGST